MIWLVGRATVKNKIGEVLRSQIVESLTGLDLGARDFFWKTFEPSREMFRSKLPDEYFGTWCKDNLRAQRLETRGVEMWAKT